MDNKLHLYSIMPLDVRHIDEICQDITEQQQTGVASHALFCMSLVPEGNPPTDKADILCGKYDLFREKLQKKGVLSGVLVQASIGHGWILGEMFPYQQYIGLRNGVAEVAVCPYDEGFGEYIYNALKRIAQSDPKHIMIDDDLSLLFRDGRGCACPLHMKRFNELAKVNFTREELWEKISKGGEEGEKYRELFLETQRESLVIVAKKMRQGIDAVNPKIPGSYCTVSNDAEFGYEIAKAVAGEGNPIVVRINNGFYHPAGARNLSSSFERMASQVAKLKGKVDIILAETDTCPQNRYSTGANSLHAHFTGSILEGANGAKHWITRLIAHEPDCGKAYRKILAKHKRFYENLAETVQTLQWKGLRIPVSKKPLYNIDETHWVGGIMGHWCRSVFERLGLPIYFSAENGGVVCFDKIADSYYTDEEIFEMLKGNMILAVESAEALIKRGFGKYVGVDVREWTGKTPTHEIVDVNGNAMSVQMGTKELVPLFENVKKDSIVCNSIDEEDFEYLFPGTTVYKNDIGGTIVTFCGTPKARFHLTEAFSFLNYSRKLQFIRLLSEMGELSVYYPGDQEVYLKLADMPNGELFCAIFNISLDPIEELPLCIEGTVSKIEKLTPDGERENVPFEKENDIYILKSTCNILDPVILFITR